MRNESDTSSSASILPVKVSCVPALLFSTVTVRTGRTAGAAVSVSRWQAVNSVGAIRIISPACRRRRVLIKWEAHADMALLPSCLTWLFLPFVDRHRRVSVDLDQERDVGTGLGVKP